MAMKWKRVLLRSALLLATVVVLVLAGIVVYAFSVGRPPERRPELVTPLPAGVPAPPAGYPTEVIAITAGWFLHDWLVWKDAPPAGDLAETYDIEFGQGGGQPLRLDLFAPMESGGARPGIVLFFGGGWKRGEKDQLRVYAQHFARHGYVAITPQYRLGEAGRWPNSVHDAKCAVRWMRAHAEEYGIDPDRIGAMGNSTGAYLALMVAYSHGFPELEGDGGWAEYSSAVQAVVDNYGPTDLTEPIRRDVQGVVDYLGGQYVGNEARYDSASPIRYVTSESPPTCVIQGTLDSQVLANQSDWLVEKLREHGVPHVYSRIDGWPHGMDLAIEMHYFVRDLSLAFFNQHLVQNRIDAAGV